METMSENLSREQWGQRGWKSVEITTRGLFLPIVLPDQESGARTLPRTSSVPPRRLRGKRSKVPLLFSRRKRFEKGRSQFCRWIELCRSIIYGELIFSASPSASKIHFAISFAVLSEKFRKFQDYRKRKRIQRSIEGKVVFFAMERL